MKQPPLNIFDEKVMPERPTCPTHTNVQMRFLGVRPSPGPLIVHTPMGTFINPDNFMLQCPICKVVSIIPLLTIYQRKETA